MNSTNTAIFSPSLRAAQPLACDIFEAAVGRGRLANAYLLTGRCLEEKLQLTRELAAYLNCASRSNGQSGSCVSKQLPAANYCQNCSWIAADEHPQALQKLAGEGRSQKIPVEKVRLMTEELAKTSSFVRVISIPEADQDTFHRPAANALLKNVEEPPEKCLFMFCADSVEDVLATIVSRCQSVPVNKKLSLGHWQPAGMTAQPEAKARWDAAYAALLANSKKAFTSQFNTGSSYLRAVNDSLETSHNLQEMSKQFQELLDSEFAVEQILDLVVACDLEVLRESAMNETDSAAYLKKLMKLVEEAKSQVNHYVKASNVIESFSFALCELRYQYSGEISLAKR